MGVGILTNMSVTPKRKSVNSYSLGLWDATSKLYSAVSGDLGTLWQWGGGGNSPCYKSVSQQNDFEAVVGL